MVSLRSAYETTSRTMVRSLQFTGLHCIINYLTRNAFLSVFVIVTLVNDLAKFRVKRVVFSSPFTFLGSRFRRSFLAPLANVLVQVRTVFLRPFLVVGKNTLAILFVCRKPSFSIFVGHEAILS